MDDPDSVWFGIGALGLLCLIVVIYVSVRSRLNSRPN
jgi:hypothetical protein